jgi:hypothetical protein
MDEVEAGNSVTTEEEKTKCEGQRDTYVLNPLNLDHASWILGCRVMHETKLHAPYNLESERPIKSRPSPDIRQRQPKLILTFEISLTRTLTKYTYGLAHARQLRQLAVPRTK